MNESCIICRRKLDSIEHVDFYKLGICNKHTLDYRNHLLIVETTIKESRPNLFTNKSCLILPDTPTFLEFIDKHQKHIETINGIHIMTVNCLETLLLEEV